MFREVVDILHIVRHSLPADLPVHSYDLDDQTLDSVIYFKDRIRLAI